MASKIEIHPQGQLVRGQKNPVQVLVRFDRETKVRGIRAIVHGAERTRAEYTVTTTGSDGKVKTETRTAVEDHDILREQVLLQGEERLGFFSRLGDSMATWAGGGKHELLGPGEVNFKLDIDIPENAPASFEGKKCEVFYQVQLAVDIPIRVDWSETEKLTLESIKPDFAETAPVHVTFPDTEGRSFWDKTFGKPVTLNLALDRDTLQIGEKALAMLTVESPEPLNIKKTTITLLGTESVVASGHHDSYPHSFPLGEVESAAVIAQESVEEFEFTIPDIGELLSQKGKNYSIEWKLQIQLHIPWAKDPIIQAPIKIV